MNGKPLLKEKDKPKKERIRKLRLIEDDLWDLCKKITRIRYKNCYTCHQRALIGKNAHTGHMYPAGACGASMKYDLRILRLQCMNCNINNGGMGAVYLENMKKEIGEQNALDLLQEARASKGKPIQAREHYLKLIADYTALLDKLSQANPNSI